MCGVHEASSAGTDARREARARTLWARVAAAPFVGAIRLYRLTLSPLLGGQCRFYPTCSQYALDAFAEHSVWRALKLTLWRLARCHPLAKGGVDTVPLRENRGQ